MLAVLAVCLLWLVHFPSVAQGKTCVLGGILSIPISRGNNITFVYGLEDGLESQCMMAEGQHCLQVEILTGGYGAARMCSDSRSREKFQAPFFPADPCRGIDNNCTEVFEHDVRYRLCCCNSRDLCNDGRSGSIFDIYPLHIHSGQPRIRITAILIFTAIWILTIIF